MKEGDLVRRYRSGFTTEKILPGEKLGTVIGLTEKKVARLTGENNVVNWDLIQPEPHAIVVWDNGTITIPVTDLEVVDESN